MHAALETKVYTSDPQNDIFEKVYTSDQKWYFRKRLHFWPTNDISEKVYTSDQEMICSKKFTLLTPKRYFRKALHFWLPKCYFRKSLHFWPKKLYFQKSLHFWQFFDILLCLLQNSLFLWIRESIFCCFLFQKSLFGHVG